MHILAYMETKWRISWQRKQVTKKQNPNQNLIHQEAKTLIRNKRLAYFKHRNAGYKPQQDSLRLLSRHEQIMIFRLITGHCRLRSHIKKDWHRRVSICPCGQDAQTIANVLQSCPLHKEEKGKHLANRKFSRKQTPWNSHRLTPDNAFHRPNKKTSTLFKQSTPNSTNHLKVEINHRITLIFCRTIQTP